MAKAPPRPGRELLHVSKLNLSSYLSALAISNAIGYPELSMIKASVPYTDEQITPPHHHDCLNFWFVLSAPMTHSIAGKRYCLQAGDLFLIPPLLEHSILDIQKIRTDAYNACFSDEFVMQSAGRPVWRKLISLFYCVPAVQGDAGGPLTLHFSGRSFDELSSLVLSIHEICRRQLAVPEPPQSLYAYARRLFTCLASADAPLTSEQAQRLSRLEAVICTALEYLYDHYRETIRLKDVAESCGLSVSRFSLLFKTITGMTLMEYANFIRTRRARHLLLHTHRTERSILKECGFHSDVYFSRVFKAYTGCPPYIFRREYTIIDL